MERGRRWSPVSEALALAEFAQLFADPLYYGAGAPSGDGRLALVLPGLFASDWYLWPLRSWLGRVGFRPVRSTLALNAGCPERLSREVERELVRRRRTVPGARPHWAQSGRYASEGDRGSPPRRSVASHPAWIACRPPFANGAMVQQCCGSDAGCQLACGGEHPRPAASRSRLRCAGLWVRVSR